MYFRNFKIIVLEFFETIEFQGETCDCGRKQLEIASLDLGSFLSMIRSRFSRSILRSSCASLQEAVPSDRSTTPQPPSPSCSPTSRNFFYRAKENSTLSIEFLYRRSRFRPQQQLYRNIRVPQPHVHHFPGSSL